MYAVIRIRGGIDMQKPIKDTLKMLRLSRVNHCVLLRQEDPKVDGMIRKVKDFVTWGEINDKTLEKMIFRRGKLRGDRPVDEKKAKEFASKVMKTRNVNDVKDLKPVFRLNSPKKGFEGIKRPYPEGALGYRKDKINELVEKML